MVAVPSRTHCVLSLGNVVWTVRGVSVGLSASQCIVSGSLGLQQLRSLWDSDLVCVCTFDIFILLVINTDRFPHSVSDIIDL